MTISEDKKKIIYIGLIVFCLVTTAAIIFMNLKGSSTPAPAPEQSPAVVSSTPTQAAGQQPVASITGQIKMLNDGNYPAPSVFPSKRQFDVSIFKSPEFLSLKSQQLPTPAPEEFGGDSFNPFRSNLKK